LTGGKSSVFGGGKHFPAEPFIDVHEKKKKLRVPGKKKKRRSTQKTKIGLVNIKKRGEEKDEKSNRTLQGRVLWLGQGGRERKVKSQKGESTRRNTRGFISTLPITQKKKKSYKGGEGEIKKTETKGSLLEKRNLKHKLLVRDGTRLHPAIRKEKKGPPS